MIGPTYYSFATADEAAKGAAMLEADDAARYGTVLLGPVMQPTGETDAEGNPVMEDAGLGYILAVLDRQSPDPVPGWEAAQVKAELVPHEWAGRRVDGLLMDEDAPESAEPIQVAARPDRDELLRLREARISRREANSEVWRIREVFETVQLQVESITSTLQVLPSIRLQAIDRINTATTRRAVAVTEREAAIAAIIDTNNTAEIKEASRATRDALVEEIKVIDATLERDRNLRDQVPTLITDLRAQRDALIVQRTAILADLSKAREDRATAIAALTRGV